MESLGRPTRRILSLGRWSLGSSSRLVETKQIEVSDGFSGWSGWSKGGTPGGGARRVQIDTACLGLPGRTAEKRSVGVVVLGGQLIGSPDWQSHASCLGILGNRLQSLEEANNGRRTDQGPTSDAGERMRTGGAEDEFDGPGPFQCGQNNHACDQFGCMTTTFTYIVA